MDKVYIEKLIIKTFKNARNMMEEKESYESPTKRPKIIYPCYSKKYRNEENSDKKIKTRISEQEIKQLFIQALIEDKKNDFYFSVETPTEFKYVFKNEPKVVAPKEVIPNEKPVSARFDLCLYRYQQNEFTREYLIEFKAKNKAKNQEKKDENQEKNNEKAKEIKKDFLKLFAEGIDQNQYFIHVIDNYDEETERSINDKYTVSMKYCETYFKARKKENIYQQKDINIYLLILNNKFNKEPDSDSKPHYFRIRSHGTAWKKIRLEEDGSFSFENYEPLKTEI